MARRWPVGLHVPAGGLPAWGSRQARPVVTDQRDYWRHSVAELHAGASVRWPLPPPPGPGPLQPFVPVSTISASTGPQGVGERWLVDLVQMQSSAQYGQPPLVVQQLIAQQSAVAVIPPPPIIAQVWLAAAGQNLHLLAQTTSGGNDDLSVAQGLSAGETIAVVWYGLATGMPAWFRLRGTKYVLDT